LPAHTWCPANCMQMIRNNDGLLSMRNNLVLQRLIILKFTGSANGCQVALAAFPRVIRHLELLDCPECISEAGGFAPKVAGDKPRQRIRTGCVPNLEQGLQSRHKI